MAHLGLDRIEALEAERAIDIQDPKPAPVARDR